MDLGVSPAQRLTTEELQLFNLLLLCSWGPEQHPSAEVLRPFNLLLSCIWGPTSTVLHCGSAVTDHSTCFCYAFGTVSDDLKELNKEDASATVPFHLCGCSCKINFYKEDCWVRVCAYLNCDIRSKSATYSVLNVIIHISLSFFPLRLLLMLISTNF